MSGYLVDTSVWHRLGHDDVAARLEELAGSLFTCVVVALDWGVSARNTDEHGRRLRRLHAATAEQLPLTPEIERRALQIQRLLVPGGLHRAVKLADLLIAAVAEANDVTVLHYDSDFDLIAKATGQPCEWAVKQGSIP